MACQPPVPFQVGRQHDHLVENEYLRVSATLLVQVHVQVHVLPFPAVQEKDRVKEGTRK
jgi:hypothetical protein